MANKKETTVETEVMEETKVADKKAQAGEEMVPYFLPKNTLSSGKHHPVIINGHIWQVQAGVHVEIPRKVAEVLDNALKTLEKAEEAAEKMALK